MPGDTQLAKIQDEVMAFARAQGPGADESFLAFLQGFYASAAPEDVAGRPPAELCAIARSAYALAAKRTSGKPAIRIFNPRLDKDGWSSSHTVVQIVNDDMPFIVASITGDLSLIRRLTLHAVHHPIFQIERDEAGLLTRVHPPRAGQSDRRQATGRESVMHIEIDAQSGKENMQALEESLLGILSDVRSVVEDYRGLMSMVEHTAANLTANPPPAGDVSAEEAIAFLRWLAADNFTFLGFRAFSLSGSLSGDPLKGDLNEVQASGLGLLRDSRRHVLRGPEGFANVTDEVRHFLSSNDPILITKANVKSTVHRQVHLDYIGVKVFDAAGKVAGEHRFVGLFTSQAYSQSPWSVPILRQKMTAIQKRLGYTEESHAGRAVVHILENFPRDEAFQTAEDGLLEVTEGVLHLQERPRIRAFIRRDPFERFVSALVYVPRELYNSTLRRAIEHILCNTFSGEVSSHYAQLSNDVLARWHFIIRTRPGNVPAADVQKINEAIDAAAKGWPQILRETLISTLGEEDGLRLAGIYAEVFDYGYREDFTPAEAVTDIVKLDALKDKDGIDFYVYRNGADALSTLRLKIYHASRTIPLSDVLPSLENLGLRVIRENSYELSGGSGACIHDFYLERPDGTAIGLDAVKPMIEALMDGIWAREIEDDGYNGLVLAAGLSAHEIVVLRAYGKYMRQLGLPFAESTVHATLVAYPAIARSLFGLFAARFDPEHHGAREAAALEAKIREGLETVDSLDEDRILRAFLNAVLATVRTNYYIKAYKERLSTDAIPAPALAFKLKTRELPEAPSPKPYREIWVYSPRVEGVHLRFGPIARGGLRWSDRRDDFRTEILGLVKAQQVKNAVIVPVGAKGGFFPKTAPNPALDRDAFMADGVACYRIFITTLLSVTDNLVKGQVKPPAGVVRHDDDDPYLVVAADKGTATFSDIANALSLSMGHWLGDAFASGGSAGYDHKKMGITAKGAWISVQRHFRETGIDVQKETIRAAGVGDMSGDVFGNGMLLTRTLKLVAAFDHRHIFLDPDPDPEVSYGERERMFNLPRSSWDDYDKSLISKGGGVYPRSLKSIPLSSEIRAVLEIEAEALSPLELMQAILKAPVDLLWFGGIGTYVKAAFESQAQAGDRANDAIRIDGNMLRAKVIGEGANLGLTQEGRIEAALHGVRLNTDFIDNSAGVDCSDKEVNIKILLADAIAHGTLKAEAREPLLAEMTDDVSAIVLEDNYLQTQAISVAAARAAAARENHQALIAYLEKAGRLDRKLENLPTPEQFRQMGDKRKGLTRPELATLIAHEKMWVLDELVDSPLMESHILRPELEWGFPKALRTRFPKELGRHQLKKHIVATTLANQIVNRAGIGFVHQVVEETGASVPAIATAYLIVREAFGFQRGWHDIDALDYKVPASLQISIQEEVARALKRFAIWVLKHFGDVANVAEAIARVRPGVEYLLEHPLAVLTAAGKEAYDARVAFFLSEGMPEGLARRIAGFEAVSPALDIVAIAEETSEQVADAGAAYFAAGQSFGFDWLRHEIQRIATGDHWDRLALNALMEEVDEQQRLLVARILAAAPSRKGAKAIANWCEDYPAPVEKAWVLIGELRASGSPAVGKASFAARQFRAIYRG